MSSSLFLSYIALLILYYSKSYLSHGYYLTNTDEIQSIQIRVIWQGLPMSDFVLEFRIYSTFSCNHIIKILLGTISLKNPVLWAYEQPTNLGPLAWKSTETWATSSFNGFFFEKAPKGSIGIGKYGDGEHRYSGILVPGNIGTIVIDKSALGNISVVEHQYRGK